MKKPILSLVLCLLLICMTACNKNSNNTDTQFPTNEEVYMQFPTNEEMYAYLEGIWEVADSGDEKTYYVFKGDQLYITTDKMYAEAVKALLDSALQNGGAMALVNQKFDTITKRMYLSDFTRTCDQITFLPNKGAVKLYEGQQNETYISITADGLSIRTANKKSSALMSKISDEIDFSIEQFQAMYNAVIGKYPVPDSLYWLNTKEYGEMVKSIIPSFDFWSSPLGSECYTPPKMLTTLDGSALVISEEKLELNYEVHIPDGFAGLEQRLTISYSPNSGSIQTSSYNNVASPQALVQYSIYAVRNFPGAYQDPVALYNAIVNTEPVYSGSDMTKKELVMNGLTYTLSVRADNKWTMFEIHTSGELYLGDIINRPRKDFTPLLDGNKAWVGPWELDDWEYNVYFVFKEDGVCCFAVGDLELLGAGKGTYTVNADDTLSVEITMDGKICTATYAFDPDAFSLTIISDKGLVGQQGEVVILEENQDFDAETVENWAEMFSNGTPDDDVDW